MNEMVKFVAENPEAALGALVGVIVLLLILVMVLFARLSSLRSLYEKMMRGEESGQSMEKMLLSHIEETRRVAEGNAKLREENARIDALLQTAITRIGVVRFPRSRIWAAISAMPWRCLTHSTTAWCSRAFSPGRIRAVM